MQAEPNTKNQYKYMVIARFRSKRRDNVKRQIIYDRRFNHYLCITPKGEPTKISISNINKLSHNITSGNIIVVQQECHFVDSIKHANPLKMMGIESNISITNFKIQQQPEKRFDDGIYFKKITRQIKQLINKICLIKEIDIPNPPQPNHYQFHSINYLNQATQIIPNCVILCKFMGTKTTHSDGKYKYCYAVQTEDKQITIVDSNKSGKSDNQLQDIQEGSNIIFCNIKYEKLAPDNPRFIYNESSYIIHSFAPEIKDIMNGTHNEFTVKGLEYLWSKQPTDNNTSIQNRHINADMNVVVVKGIIEASNIKIGSGDTDIEEKKDPDEQIVINNITAKHIIVDAQIAETNVSSAGPITIQIHCYKNAIKHFYDYLEGEFYPLHDMTTDEATSNLYSSYQQNKDAYSKELVIKGDQYNFVNTDNMDMYIPLVKSFFIEYNKKQNVTIQLINKKCESNDIIYSILDINYHDNNSMNNSESHESRMPILDNGDVTTSTDHNAKTPDTNANNTHQSSNTNQSDKANKDVLPTIGNLTLDDCNEMDNKKQEMVNNNNDKDEHFEADNTNRICPMKEDNRNGNKAWNINTGNDSANSSNETISKEDGQRQLIENNQGQVIKSVSNTEKAGIPQRNTSNNNRTNHRKRKFNTINDNAYTKDSNTHDDTTNDTTNSFGSPSTSPPGPNKAIADGGPAYKKPKIQ